MKTTLRRVGLTVGLALASAAVCGTTVAEAQRVSGRVQEEASGSPIPAALVVLLTGEERVGGAISDPEGRFTIAAPGPGEYRLLVERIGYTSTRSETFRLEEGQVLHLDLATSVEPASLEGITVTGERRCVVRPDHASEIQRVWDAARKALSATDLTRDLSLVRWRAVDHLREIDPLTGEVRSDTSHVRPGWGTQAYVTVPPEQLLERGFVWTSGDTTRYLTPDAEVLLSDEFLETHCFELVAGDSGLIGLGFEPVRKRRVPDISGVMWIDVQSGELRSLDFRYTRVPGFSGPVLVPGSTNSRTDGFTWVASRLGGGRGAVRPEGRVEFEHLPGGAWIIRRWNLRVPRTLRYLEGAEVRTVLGHIQEEGGEVVQISIPGHEDRRAITATVVGSVMDSTTAAPVAGARVYLSGTAAYAISSASGEFVLELPSEGDFLVGFTHPMLDTLGIAVPPVRVTLVRGDTSRTSLAIPSETSILAGRCGPGRGVGGVVRDSLTGERLVGAKVRTSGTAESQTVSSSRGHWVICGPPSAEPISIHAELAGITGNPVQVQPGSGFLRQDLSIPLSTGVTIAGRVLDFPSGAPIPGATIQIAGSHATLTNTQGHFSLTGIPHGRHTLRIRHLGYGEHVDTVDARNTRTLDLTVRLPSRAIAMEGVVATVSAEPRVPLGTREFHRRRERSIGGTFLGPEEIRRRPITSVTDLLKEVPGVRLSGDGVRGGSLLMSRTNCAPAVYLDGVPIYLPTAAAGPTDGHPAFDAISMVHAADLVGIEIYAGASQVPGEFGGSSGGCGVVAMWTRRGH